MAVEVYSPRLRSFDAPNGGRHIVHVVTGDGRVKSIQWAATVGTPWLNSEALSGKGEGWYALTVKHSRAESGASLLSDDYRNESPGKGAEGYAAYVEWDQAAREGRAGSARVGVLHTDGRKSGDADEPNAFQEFPESRLPKSVITRRRGTGSAKPAFRVDAGEKPKRTAG